MANAAQQFVTMREDMFMFGKLGGLPSLNPGMCGPLPGAHGQAAPAAIAAARADRRARILVVEDHEFLRSGIIGLLDAQPDLICCGESDTMAGTRLAVAQAKPDLILLDLNLKDGQALEFIGDLRLEFPDAKILVLSQLDEAIYAPRVLRAGAKGYIMKEAASENLFDAVRVVLSGGTYLSSAMAAGFRPGKPERDWLEWATPARNDPYSGDRHRK
jgi:DNA-binding NarL/FixJ family response regulator